MNRTVEMMIDDVIRRYGFEAKQTIKFCTIAEGNNYSLIKAYYNRLMK